MITASVYRADPFRDTTTTQPTELMTFLRPFLCLLAVSAFLVGSAHGQANLTITGGNGSPFTFTLAQAVTYTVTATTPLAPLPVFANVGNIFGNSYPAVSGTITFSVNGGPATTLTVANSGFVGGALTANDLYFYGNRPGVTSGDTVVVTAGSLTTDSSFAQPPPASGTFTTFLVDDNGNRVSLNGTSVPEPGSLALLAMGGLGLIWGVARRRAAV